MKNYAQKNYWLGVVKGKGRTPATRIGTALGGIMISGESPMYAVTVHLARVNDADKMTLVLSDANQTKKIIFDNVSVEEIISQK